MPLVPYLGHLPHLSSGVTVHPDGFVVGHVTVGASARIGRRAVLRGDQASITVGERFLIGEEATVHVDPGCPTVIGDNVVVENRAVVHGCRIGDSVLVEREATVLTGSVVGEGSIIQANALVPEGREIPPRSLVVGTPGRVIRSTTDDEVASTVRRAASAQDGEALA